MEQALNRIILTLMILAISLFQSWVVVADEIEKGLLYWKNNNEAVEMQLYLPGKKSSLLMAILKDIPDKMFFSADWKEMFYIHDRSLYRMEWKLGAESSKVLTYPEDWSDINNTINWRDKKTGRWRFAWDDGLLSKYQVVDKDGEKYLNYKGQMVLIKNGYYPSNDIKYALEILNVLEYDEKSGWQEIAHISTVCSTHGDPCYSALGSYQNQDGLITDYDIRKSSFDPYSNFSRYESRKHGSSVDGKSENLPYFLFNQASQAHSHGVGAMIHGSGSSDTKRSDDYKEEDYSLFITRPETEYLIKVKTVEEGYMYPALYLVHRKTNKEHVLIPENNQLSRYDFIGLSQNNNYLLVTLSSVGGDGSVIDLRDSRKVFIVPEGLPSLWVGLPDSIGPR